MRAKPDMKARSKPVSVSTGFDCSCGIPRVRAAELSDRFTERIVAPIRPAPAIEGKFMLTLDGETRQLAAGDVVVVPSDVAHAGKAITRCRILDVWHPPRDDYR
jgi:hypothetical protein